MKRSLTQLLGGYAILFAALTACKKDEVRTVAQPGSATTLTSSVTSSAAAPITLLQTRSDSVAIKYSWTPASFGYQAVVTYTLQFDKKGGDFSSPISFGAGTSLSKTLTVYDLNSVYQAKGLVSTATTPTPTPVDIRVVASIGDGAVVTSAVSTVTATPYAFCAQPAANKAWSIIGSVGPGGPSTDWSTDYPMVYDCSTKTYTYTGALRVGEYKFRFGKSWDANLGGSSSTGGTLSQGANNLKITTAGTYTIVLTPTNDTAGQAAGSYTIK